MFPDACFGGKGLRDSLRLFGKPKYSFLSPYFDTFFTFNAKRSKINVMRNKFSFSKR